MQYENTPDSRKPTEKNKEFYNRDTLKGVKGVEEAPSAPSTSPTQPQKGAQDAEASRQDQRARLPQDKATTAPTAGQGNASSSSHEPKQVSVQTPVESDFSGGPSVRDY